MPDSMFSHANSAPLALDAFARAFLRHYAPLVIFRCGRCDVPSDSAELVVEHTSFTIFQTIRPTMDGWNVSQILPTALYDAAVGLVQDGTIPRPRNREDFGAALSAPLGSMPDEHRLIVHLAIRSLKQNAPSDVWGHFEAVSLHRRSASEVAAQERTNVADVWHSNYLARRQVKRHVQDLLSGRILSDLQSESS